MQVTVGKLVSGPVTSSNKKALKRLCAIRALEERGVRAPSTAPSSMPFGKSMSPPEVLCAVTSSPLQRLPPPNAASTSAAKSFTSGLSSGVGLGVSTDEQNMMSSIASLSGYGAGGVGRMPADTSSRTSPIGLAGIRKLNFIQKLQELAQKFHVTAPQYIDVCLIEAKWLFPRFL